MPISANAGYQGQHDAPNGSVVRVFFVPGTTTRPYNRSRGYKREMPAYRHFGWYWLNLDIAYTDPLDSAKGAYTSSRLAYQDAMHRNKRRSAA